MDYRYLNEQLICYGLVSQEADLYVMLLSKGNLTPLELARETGLNRTSIYRYLETLKHIGIVEEIVDYKTTRFKASNPEKLTFLIKTKEEHLEKLKQSLPGLISNLSQIEDPRSDIQTKVVYFRGQSGIRQLMWNTLKTKSEYELLNYGYLNWNEAVGFKFAEKLRFEHQEKMTKSKEINNSAMESVSVNYEYTKIGKSEYYEERYLSKDKLEINHDLYIYNDVIAYMHFFNNEYFGIEIHNAEIAKTQRQIFNLLWEMAEVPNLNIKIGQRDGIKT